jgi:hypothetical protein
MVVKALVRGPRSIAKDKAGTAEAAMLHRIILAIAAACTMTSCNEPQQSAKVQEPAAPPGWQKLEVLPRSGAMPAVTAILPPTARRTNLVGIENPAFSYEAEDLKISFDYGARVHPGCAASPCRLDRVQVGGRTAQVAISGKTAAAKRSIYYVPLLEQGDPKLEDPLAGGGLLVSADCRGPACEAAGQVVQSIRFMD